MYQYRMFTRAISVSSHLMKIAGGLIGLLLLAETARLYLLLRRAHPIAGYTFLGLVVLAAILLFIRIMMHVKNHRTLTTYLPDTDHAGHKQLRRTCKVLALYCRRLSQSPGITDATSHKLEQQVYDIRELLGSHPLNEDLVRMIRMTEDEVIAGAFREIEGERKAITLDKMQAVIEDMNQPPFPVIKPLVMLYHQVTMISQVVDLYVPRASLLEYGRAIRDVWDVMTKGDFIRLGQRLFEGIYENAPPMGQASDDLGQAITTIWITQSISKSAAQRCRAYEGWDLHAAIDWMDTQTIPGLHTTRDVLLNTVMPLIKSQLRHSAPPGMPDREGFTDTVTRGISKTVETVVREITANSERQQAQLEAINAQETIETFEGTSQAPEGDPVRPRRHRRRRRKRRTRGPARIWHLITQRFRYGRGGGPYRSP